MNQFFKLEERGTTVAKEVAAGVTTFFTMLYIMSTNPAILSIAGMPQKGVFAATVLTAGFSTLIFAFYANVPFASAPGMGLNAFFAFTICVEMDYHWREGMALVFLAGAIHMVLMATGLRKIFVRSIPEYMKYATSAGLGLFIAYVGVKNADLVTFTVAEGHYRLLDSGMMMVDATAFTAFVQSLTASHGVALVGLLVTLYLLAMEKKTGDKYGALLLGILVATFVGIPLGVTTIANTDLVDWDAFAEISSVALSFLGDPGMSSLFATPVRAVTSILLLLALLYNNLLDSLTSCITTGIIGEKPVFDARTTTDFAEKPGISTPLDRALIANTFGGVLASVFGTSTSTCYIESGAGVAAGGRTGLTALTTAVLFFLCLPIVNIFAIIPVFAVAPALIIAGSYFIALVRKIDWSDFEQAIPASLTVLFIPGTLSIMHGFAVGLLAHMAIQVSLGHWRRIPLFIYGSTLVFAGILAMRFVLVSGS